jgi:hypothetical protein
MSGVLTDPTVSTVYFRGTTSATVASVRFYLDGVYLQNGWTPSGGTAGVDWEFGGTFPSGDTAAAYGDGSYVLSLQAFDASSQPLGERRTMTFTMNKYATPFNSATTASSYKLVGGANGSVAEVEWYPQVANARKDRDLAGWRIRRGTSPGSATTIASQLSPSQTSYIDLSPPGGSPNNYYLHALDHAPDGSIRQSAASLVVNAAASNGAPYPPTGLAVSSSGGTTTLTWNVPTQHGGRGDPNGGDYVDFFRIYRDGTDISTNRYDRTPFGVSDSGGVSNSYVDLDPGGTTHTYRVTSVDTKLRESTFAGPVTG